MSFYLVPITGAGTSADKRRPSFVPALGVSWSMVDIGDSCIVWADATPAQDAIIAGSAGAVVIPPLDSQVALAATQTQLESLNIPSQWVTAQMTYRTVLRVVVGMAQLVQRCQGLGIPIVIAGNLDKTISQFSAQIQNGLATAVDSLMLDRSNITGATTLRQALFIIGQQFVNGRTIVLGDL